MDRKTVKVSIIAPCLNSIKTIRQTIESVRNQTYKNIEYIIVDGGSTDETVDIIREYVLLFEGYLRYIIDMSPLMIDIAKENSRNMNADIDFSVVNIRSYEPKNKYDAAISLFHVMSYQNTNEDILAAFRGARKALDDGGTFFVLRLLCAGCAER